MMRIENLFLVRQFSAPNGFSGSSFGRFTEITFSNQFWVMWVNVGRCSGRGWSIICRRRPRLSGTSENVAFPFVSLNRNFQKSNIAPRKIVGGKISSVWLNWLNQHLFCTCTCPIGDPPHEGGRRCGDVRGW